jgi:carbonic anhydrase/acetyltransferase-like protein (isoleucine patch superfamily)
MSIWALGSLEPQIHPTAYVHPEAVVIGDVRIGAQASIWPTAVLRGDHGGHIVVGERTSVQDGTVAHTTERWPTAIGDDCVVGHNAHLEGCTIGSECLVGSGSIVLSQVVVEAGAAVGAGAFVAEGTLVPAGQIALGVPARCRPVPERLRKWLPSAVQTYLDLAAQYRLELRRLD